ncbi:phage holin family protein [Nonomuraea sp. KC401]|uniref:Phage holin family protein n=1 Tax=Nonomuraea longispora TaxID=1848320 RepID=A0A4R4N4F9_9ACTN|nr:MULTISPECIES: phage holin family protein [Nonomuraea]NBE98066.1 phage holin family protein [Nonomuraea sp. K271]TDC03628.1 phage holin family protein [Nonomuraea longispora]TLF61748.1 phage holin family protein [Nonomuraea sp. KC401]
MNDTHKLVNDLSEQVSRLVRDELRLARMELQEKGRHAGFGAGLFGAAGVVALFGGGALVAAVVMLLALFLPGWVAAAIVAVVLFIVAAVLGLTGRKQVKRAGPPVPRETLASVRADIDMVKEKARR